jgi:sugar lactone lactonase YvrE
MPLAKPLDFALPRSTLGEGVHWDAASRCLFWVDIGQQRFHRLNIQNGAVNTYDTSCTVSFVFPVSPTRVWLGLANGLYLRDLEADMEQIIAHLGLPEGHRLNDGKCDPKGKLWVGTINTSEDASETAALYKLEGSTFVEVDSGYLNANGKAWSADGTLMYHADTNRGLIWQWDYDLEASAAYNKRVFGNLGKANPDGLAIDVEGNVYAALYGGSAIAVFSARGHEVERIELPVPNPTSCAFGGDDMHTLFITTAGDGMDDDALQKSPQSGQLFAAELPVRGVGSPSPSQIERVEMEDRT